MKIKGEGIFQHIFHGTSICGAIAVFFASKEDARDAMKALGEGWEQSNKDPRGIIRSLSRYDLDALIPIFARHGYRTLPCSFYHCEDRCRNAAIDNLNHSIDFGARFELDVEIEPTNVNQKTLGF